MAGWKVIDDAPAKPAPAAWRIIDDTPPAAQAPAADTGRLGGFAAPEIGAAIPTPEPSKAVSTVDTAASDAIQPRLRKQMDTGRVKMQPLTGEQMAQGLDDLMRTATQGATFNYSDEIVAKVRSLLGEDYAKALEQEREGIRNARYRLGKGGTVAAETVGAMLPAGKVAQGIQYLAGAGRGIAQTARAITANTAAGAAEGTASAYGAQDKKDLGAAVATGGTTGAVIGFGSYAIPAAVTGAGRMANAAYSGVAERLRGAAADAMPSTVQKATRRIADAAEEGGITSPQQLQGRLQEWSLPNTPSTPLNTGNSRLDALASEQAKQTRVQTAPAARGAPEGEQMVDRMARVQNVEGQGDALRQRVLDSALPTPMQNAADVAERSALGHQFLSRELGQVTGPTNTPGLGALVRNDPTARQLYEQAVETAGIAGRGSVRGAPAWDAINDRNVPAEVLKEMRMLSGGLSAPGAARFDEIAGSRLTPLLDGIMARGGGTAAHISDVIGRKHTLHVFDEGSVAGRQVPKADPAKANDAVAAFRTVDGPTAPDVRNAQRFGYVQGVANEIDANRNNLGRLRDNFMPTAASEQAYNAMAGTIMPLDQLRREIRNAAALQETTDRLRRISEGRGQTGDQTLEKGARVISGTMWSPVTGGARIVRDFLSGMTQQRRREVLRQLTTPEGVNLLVEELRRREELRNTPVSVLYATVVNTLAQVSAGELQRGN